MAIANYTVNKRPSVTAFAFGRIWYAGVDDIKWRSRLFYSQVMTSINVVGKCYQDADPTSDQINAQVASDGGYINIPDLGNTLFMTQVQSGLVIVADNGVWVIQPDTSGFSPTSFTVSRITEIPGLGRKSVVEMEGTLMYAADVGIIQIAIDNTGRQFSASSVTDQVIDQFYRVELTSSQKKGMRIVYDKFSKKLWCFYDLEYNNKGKYLQFDARKGAWVKGDFLDDTLVAHAWLPLTTLKGNPVSGLRVLLRWDDNGTISYPVAEFNDASFYDFGIPTALFDSYLEFAPLTLDNPQFNKQATYITNYFAKTESTWKDNGSGEPTFDYPSGVDVTFKWDYAQGVNATTSRVTKPQQGYRFQRALTAPSIGAKVNIPQTSIQTKLLVRGRGHSLSVRYDSQLNKDFQLQGFTLPMSMDGSY